MDIIMDIIMDIMKEVVNDCVGFFFSITLTILPNN